MSIDTMANELRDFAKGYAECALWADLQMRGDYGEINENQSPEEIARQIEEADSNAEMGAGGEWPEWFDKIDTADGWLPILRDCGSFFWDNYGNLLLYCDRREVNSSEGTPMSYAGHDFWLTRNGHGAGFWDRGLGVLGEQLTEFSKPFGEANCYVGDDGKVYFS